MWLAWYKGVVGTAGYGPMVCRGTWEGKLESRIQNSEELTIRFSLTQVNESTWGNGKEKETDRMI